MIIEVEDRFCKTAKQCPSVLENLEQAAYRGEAVHEVLLVNAAVNANRQANIAVASQGLGRLQPPGRPRRRESRRAT